MPPEDEIKETGIATFVSLKQGRYSSLELVDELK